MYVVKVRSSETVSSDTGTETRNNVKVSLIDFANGETDDHARTAGSSETDDGISETAKDTVFVPWYSHKFTSSFDLIHFIASHKLTRRYKPEK